MEKVILSRYRTIVAIETDCIITVNVSSEDFIFFMALGLGRPDSLIKEAPKGFPTSCARVTYPHYN